MKMEKLFLGLFASLLMVGCSQNDDLSGANEEQGKGKDSYIAVKICAPKDLGSRASVTGDDDFADATEAEGNVTKAHFFFFNDNGEHINVGEGKNYKVIEVKETADNDGNKHTESLVEAVVVLEKPSVMPTRMVAVLNWNYSGVSLDLTTLNTILATEAEAFEANTGFLMSNSVYYDNGIVNYTKIDGGNFAATTDLAKQYPVTMYVERLAAKLTSSLSITGNTEYDATVGAFDTGVTYTTGTSNESVKIYAKILGWQINTTNPNSYLVKQIEESWGTTAPPFGDWNEATKFRSYWANSASAPATGYNNMSFSWEDGLASLANDGKYSFKSWFGYDDQGQNDDVAYCLENTTSVPTKAIFKAELGKYENSTWTPLTIWQWYSKYYLTRESMMTDVVANIKQRLANLGSSVTVTETQIALAYAAPGTAADEFYKGYFHLATGVEDCVVDPATGKTLNDVVKETVYAKKWQDGATYYFTKVNHLNYMDAVVRNHAYDLQVVKVVGLGTPGNKPDPDPEPNPDPDPDPDPEPIIPEPVDPSETETYIAAKINVLSWRLINNNVILGKN